MCNSRNPDPKCNGMCTIQDDEHYDECVCCGGSDGVVHEWIAERNKDKT